MSTEKSDALVIRLADFSESSRVVTLFTREQGKVAALAKGAKRLRGPFEAALDLLSFCRVVFIRKSSGGLDLLTEAQLTRRFAPPGRDLNALYGGYYVAELLDGLTEEHDPHPDLFDAALRTLDAIASGSDPRLPILQFELTVLKEVGRLPELDACCACHQPLELGAAARFWVSQGGLICPACSRPEYQHSEIQPGTVALLRALADDDSTLAQRLSITPRQYQELRRTLTSAISHTLERRPKMLALLKF
ncbi:MAG: DNA repair protein RecO [Planctomyces sp.]|nr:DNA repair protein RecO [Planctomyces sp.]